MSRTMKTAEAEQEASLRRYALVAGIGYAVLFFLAIFAKFFVREGLIVAGDAAQTARNIGGSELLFRLGLVSFLVVFPVDVVIAWALYVLFMDAGKNFSLLAAWFRIVYSVFLGAALVFFFQALQWIGGAEFLAVFSVDQLNAQALVALESFNPTWLIGLTALLVIVAVPSVVAEGWFGLWLLARGGKPAAAGHPGNAV